MNLIKPLALGFFAPCFVLLFGLYGLIPAALLVWTF